MPTSTITLNRNNHRHIFVFGSNRQGRHGKGAALHARIFYDAIYRQSEGLQGRAYAIPTKDTPYTTLPLSDVEEGVQRFLTVARENSHLTFFVSAIGCGLAGFTPEQIAPLFKGHSDNVKFLDDRFTTILASL